MESEPHVTSPRGGRKAATGIDGLGRGLHGGLLRNRVHLVQGGPGTGKTTAALQFLADGAHRGERTLFITLAQTEEELHDLARSHGWPLKDIHVRNLTPEEVRRETEQTLFKTSEVELGEATDALLEVVREVEPERAVFDSIAEIRLLAGTSLRFRREILMLKQFFAKRDCTVLLIDGDPGDTGDRELQIFVHGVFRLHRHLPDYGDDRRRLQVVKMHGTDFHGGYHDYRITTGGLEVYPRLKIESSDEIESSDNLPGEGAPGEGERAKSGVVKSGIAELDEMLGGGLAKGAACMIAGPDGTGKTSLATCYIYAAAKRGEPSALYLFDERPGTFFERAESFGMDLRPFVEDGLVTLREIYTGEISPGEFAHLVRGDIHERGARIVVIDSLSGYANAMPQERLLMIHMQELLSYLSRQEVLSFLVVSEQGIVGSTQEKEVDVGYMADSILLLRHFEAEGAIHQALSIVKKRHGPHERAIRQFKISPEGLRVGPPIEEFSGVLTGTPTFEGNPRHILA